MRSVWRGFGSSSQSKYLGACAFHLRWSSQSKYFWTNPRWSVTDAWLLVWRQWDYKFKEEGPWGVFKESSDKHLDFLFRFVSTRVRQNNVGRNGNIETWTLKSTMHFVSVLFNLSWEWLALGHPFGQFTTPPFQNVSFAMIQACRCYTISLSPGETRGKYFPRRHIVDGGTVGVSQWGVSFKPIRHPKLSAKSAEVTPTVLSSCCGMFGPTHQSSNSLLY